MTGFIINIVLLRAYNDGDEKRSLDQLAKAIILTESKLHLQTEIWDRNFPPRLGIR